MVSSRRMLALAAWMALAPVEEDLSRRTGDAAPGLSLRPGGPAPVPSDAARRFNRRRVVTQQAGMGVLTAWAAVNLGVGGALGLTGEGTWAHFHRMNFAWNTVNLTLGAVGLAGTRREDPRLGFAAGAARARRAQEVFAINVALDVLYLMAGYVVFDQGRVRDSERLTGWGAAVLLQGGFLLAFDAAMIAAHGANLRRFRGCCTLAGGPAPGGGFVGLGGRF